MSSLGGSQDYMNQLLAKYIHQRVNLRSLTFTIGMKQGCPLSPTLFGFYTDEVFNYIDRESGTLAPLAGTWVPFLIYADDIVLIIDSPEEMHRYLQTYAKDSNLTMNLGKTIVEYVTSYVYLGVLFTSPVFSMRAAAEARLTQGYAALGGLERMCLQVQFQEPRTKLCPHGLLCHRQPEIGEHCLFYYEMRRFHCLFQEGFDSLFRVMDYCD